MTDLFTDIPFKSSTLDLYIARKGIMKSIQNSLHYFTGNLLDVGCGKMPYKNFILQNSKVDKYTGLDIESAIKYDEQIVPDIFWDGISIPLANDSFNTIIATEVLEHCPQPALILKEINRVLTTGSFFFFTVPFFWPLHEVPHDEFRFTPFSLKRLMEDAGFENIDIKSIGGWHAAMAQMLGLWVNRAPINTFNKNLLYPVLKPTIKYLLKRDEKTVADFKEGQMITGLYGIAQKK